MSDYDQLKKYFVKRSNRLMKSRIPNQNVESKLLRLLDIPTFEDLTAINQKRTTLESKQCNTVIDLLKKASEDFLASEIRLFDDENSRLHPMDVVYQALKNALPESKAILVKNLDKMKLALPLVIPNYSSRPKMNIWPLIGISRQTREQSFNLYNRKHHVIAAVRLGNCDGLDIKLSTLSKSEILNEVFFEGEHRFLSRTHKKLAETMKKNQLGSIETCIHTPNKTLNQFLQVWNLQGNVHFEGLEAQTKLINKYASVIIVILDDDEDLELMNNKIIDLFGIKQRIIVLLREKRIETDSWDSDDEDHENPSSIFPQFNVITFKSENAAVMYERTRSLVSNYCMQEGSFTLETIENDGDIRSLFDIDVKESILQTPTRKVKDMLSKINLRYRGPSWSDVARSDPVRPTDVESLQKCFPLYYSRSSIDESKKIVEHIEFLEQTKVQFFRQHQRGEFEMENQIDENINKLRQQQSRIAHESTLAVQYMDDIKDLKSRDSLEIQYEKIRLYHKGLAFCLARFNKDGVDIVGFQRELGQLFIALNAECTTSKPKRGGRKNDANIARSKITQTLKSVVEAGVSIELIDGDTQSLNQDIIVSLLESLR